MCLKQSFFHSKWVLRAILSLTVLSSCLSGSSNFDTAFFPLTVPNFVVFFRLLDRKFNENSKNVFNTVIFSLQRGFYRRFCP